MVEDDAEPPNGSNNDGETFHIYILSFAYGILAVSVHICSHEIFVGVYIYMHCVQITETLYSGWWEFLSAFCVILDLTCRINDSRK